MLPAQRRRGLQRPWAGFNTCQQICRSAAAPSSSAVDCAADAITAFDKAIDLKGGVYPEAQNNLGLALVQTGRPVDGIKSLAVAQRQKPELQLIGRNMDRVVSDLLPVCRIVGCRTVQ